MRRQPPGNVAASVRARLLNLCKGERRPFNEVLDYYAMERFLYRLAESRHANAFVLKGGLAFVAWNAPGSRPTRDIDLLGRLPNDVSTVVRVVQDICQQRVVDDGVIFDAAGVTGSPIAEAKEYSGVRVVVRGHLDGALINLQVDVGFGDVIVPGTCSTLFPTLLRLPAARVEVYSKESVIAEKLEAAVKLDVLNSRMRDFYDIWLLLTKFPFDAGPLREAIKRTFETRRTPIPGKVGTLLRALADDPTKQGQWSSLLRKSKLVLAPAAFSEVVLVIAAFLEPVISGPYASGLQSGKWSPAEGVWA